MKKITQQDKKQLTILLTTRAAASAQEKAGKAAKDKATLAMSKILGDNTEDLFEFSAEPDDKGRERYWKWEVEQGEKQTLSKDLLITAMVKAGIKPEKINAILDASYDKTPYIKRSVRAVLREGGK